MTTLTTDMTPEDKHSHPAAEQERPRVRGAWILVMNREIVVRALNKTFLAGLVVSIAIIAALAAFFAWQGSRIDQQTVVVTPGDDTAVAAVQAAAGLAERENANVEIDTLEATDASAARAALDADEADAWLHRDDAGWTLTGVGEPDSTLTRLLAAGIEQEVVAQNAAAAGTTVDELTRGATLTTDRIDPAAIDQSVLIFASLGFGVLFLLAAIGSGYLIASSVVEEKQSRLVEIMAVAVPLRQLLAGKIVGNSVIALGQTLLFAAFGLIAVSFTSVANILPALSTSLIWFVVFFAVGFLALASLYAVAGALASRAEDIQHTTSPMTMVVMAVYFVAISASGTFATVLSYVPIASVVTMPLRVLSGDAAWWEPLLALLILAVFASVAVLVCERAYRGALLQTGGRISWRQALRAQA